MKNKEIMEIRFVLSLIALYLILRFHSNFYILNEDQIIKPYAMLVCMQLRVARFFFAKPHIRMYITCEKSANKLEQTHRWDLQSSNSN